MSDDVDEEQEIQDIPTPTPPETDSTWIIFSTLNECKYFIRCQFNNCGIAFEKFEQFQRHFTEDHYPVEDAVLCDSCGVNGCHFTYDNLSTYRRHLSFHIYHALLEHKGAKTLQESCSLETCSHKNDEPNNIVYDGEPLHCSWDTCACTFDDVSDFFAHVASHGKMLDSSDKNEESSKFACSWTHCSYETKRKFEIISHLRHHSGEKMVACPNCGAFFANATKFLDHVSRQISTESARLKCFLCNKIFASQRLLRDHSRRHISRYKCPFCDMTSATPSTLRVHLKHRHSDKMPFICSVCFKGFKTRIDLERHTAKHSDAAAHVCGICSKTFKWFQSLQSHERQHYQIDQSPYVCHLCPKKYRTGTLLSRHFNAVHDLALPPGHSRFTYKKCADGYYRVLTERYESAQLSTCDDAPIDVPMATSDTPAENQSTTMSIAEIRTVAENLNALDKVTAFHIVDADTSAAARLLTALKDRGGSTSTA